MAIYFSDEAQLRAAHVINSASFSNTTRTSCPGTVGADNPSASQLWTWTYNKKVSTSYLCAFGYAYMHSAHSGHLQCNWRQGSSYHMGGWSFDYTGQSNYAVEATIHIPLNNYAGSQTTGNITMGLAYAVNSASDGNKPASILNPTGSDDSRLHSGTRSWVTVMEVLL